MLFLARIVDGLSGGNISTARAYVADITEPKDRSRAYGIIGAAFGLGFILGPALSGVLAPVSYTAPIWAAAAHYRRGHADGDLLAAGDRASRSRRRPACRLRSIGSMMRRPQVRRVLAIDFVYWLAFAVFQTTFALFVAHRFGFDAGQTGLLLRGVRRARCGGAGGAHPADRWTARRQDDVHPRPGLLDRRPGRGHADVTRWRCSRWRSSRWRSASASVIRPCRVWSAARRATTSKDACRAPRAPSRASAARSVRCGAMRHCSASATAMPYLSAAGFLLMTLLLSLGYQVSDSDTLR